MNSGKTYMIIGGKLAKVPMDLAKKFEKKETLVARAASLNDYINSCGVEVKDRIASSAAVAQLQQTMAQIIRLNRSLPPCVEFV